MIMDIATKSVPLLKIQGLSKQFHADSFWGKGIRVVDSIDMQVGSGEIRGIVGESGSGKTTLARCSIRLIEPTSGSIQFDGQDLESLGAAALRAKRKEFQMIFQDPYASLNPEMTVKQILMEPFQVHKMGSENDQNRRLGELLEAVSLSESLLKRKPAELSGGQQQRVGIARSLILKPRLVIADEPVSALDASVQTQILNLLADIKKQYKLTLILISHSLNAVHYLCTHVSVMYKGRIIEEAPAASFFKHPKHPYSRILLNSTLSLDASRKNHSIPAGVDTSPSKNAGCAFYLYCPDRLLDCANRVPALSEISAGEKVACFLYSQTSELQRQEIR